MKENIVLFTTKNLAVRRLKSEDADLIYKYSRQESHKELPNDIFDSVEDARRRMDNAISNYRIEHLPLFFAVVYKPENIVIGVLSYKRMPDYNIQINVSITEDYQNRGLGTELVKSSADFAKDHFGIDTVYACTRSINAPARSALEKAGFMLVSEEEQNWFGTMQPICKYEI